jgi:hypothetical protein
MFEVDFKDDEFALRACEEFWSNLDLDAITSALTPTRDDIELALVEFHVPGFEEENDNVVDPVCELQQDDGEEKNRKEKNRKRRLNEVERLEKYSWVKVPDDEKTKSHKNVRYQYFNRSSGQKVSSLKVALQQCSAVVARKNK